MADATNGEGFRITIGVLYAKLEEQARAINSLERQLVVTNAQLATILAENVRDKDRIGKLETRMNGVFTGLGVGILTAVVVLFRGVIG